MRPTSYSSKESNPIEAIFGQSHCKETIYDKENPSDSATGLGRTSEEARENAERHWNDSHLRK